ncbi:hypothetical protein F4U96_20210 [Sphingobium limneticum]|uniref:Uncharacterized protein n=1 Tax=Sphingobium limneticum TaxID=1007511 RepID=A0A5J5HS76_9SPHN|nr:hypothetical protein F4U96_20210 [Sphingobium limneticum]KAA9025227.1 hypothetical protein F4U95_20335 [Sphingobium limneticum]
MLHPLTQWADRSSIDRDSHGKFLFVEGTSNLRRRPRPAKGPYLQHYDAPRDPPAQRVRAWVVFAGLGSRVLGHRVIDVTTLVHGTKSPWRFNAGG